MKQKQIFLNYKKKMVHSPQGKNAAAAKLQTDYYFRKRISIRLWGGQSSLQMAC